MFGKKKTAQISRGNIVPFETTEFDNRLFKDIKLRELPRFLWQNRGYTGYQRFMVFMQRWFGSPSHPLPVLRVRPIKVFFWSFMLFNFYDHFAEKIKQRDIILEKRFGRHGLQQLTPAEQKYYKIQVAKEIAKTHTL